MWDIDFFERLKEQIRKDICSVVVEEPPQEDTEISAEEEEYQERIFQQILHMKQQALGYRQ